MLFNSVEFAIFLPIVFVLYWFVMQRNLKLQNVFLIVVSYIFYGWWDWKFLFLIGFSTLWDYLIGNIIDKQEDSTRRKLFLAASVIVNLSLLGFFKYFNFFIDSFVTAFTFLGYPLEARTLNIILPVGISFYTFQSLSYTIDIYKKKLKPAKDLLSFAAFISFFPQLVAGPIERAVSFLPQFQNKRVFEYSQAVNGLRQILWGLFKKVVIADTSAIYVNIIFADVAGYSGSTLMLGVLLFAFQIYGDFSGYTDIALGVARLFGFELRRNFAFPYFSRNISEFWNRWHISLSSWFRDYVYIPLGGNRVPLPRQVINIFIVFLLSGLWHGANWTFVVWGLLNAIYIAPLIIFKKTKEDPEIVAQGKLFPSAKEVLNMTVTFLLTLFAWIFFRAESITKAFEYIQGIFRPNFFSVPQILPVSLFIVTIFFFIIEWIGREQEYAIEKLPLRMPKVIRIGFYYFLLLLIFLFWGNAQQFIYFQF